MKDPNKNVKGKKQAIRYGGVDRKGAQFVTENFNIAVFNSVIDPKPLNRKSVKNMFREVRKLELEGTDEYEKEKTKKLSAYRKIRKDRKAAGYLRRRAANKRK